MQRRLRILGAVLLLVGVAILVEGVALQFDDGMARTIAAHSTCNSEPCTMAQLQRMMLFVAPVSFLVLGGFGLALLKARVAVPPPVSDLAIPAAEPTDEAGDRLRAIDRLREREQITAMEHAEQRRRILDSV